LPVFLAASTANPSASQNSAWRDSTRIDTVLRSFADYAGNSCSATDSGDEKSIENRFRVKTVRSRFVPEPRSGCDIKTHRPLIALA
jgi:hypothetical protein